MKLVEHVSRYTERVMGLPGDRAEVLRAGFQAGFREMKNSTQIKGPLHRAHRVNIDIPTRSIDHS